MKRMTNQKFSKADRLFIEACKMANVEVTKRQASKFRRNIGLASKFRNKALQQLIKIEG